MARITSDSETPKPRQTTLSALLEIDPPPQRLILPCWRRIQPSTTSADGPPSGLEDDEGGSGQPREPTRGVGKIADGGYR